MAAYTHRVTALNGLFLRTGPSPNYPKIGLMPFGTPLRVTSTDASNWHKIDLATNLVATAKVNGTDLLQYNPQSLVTYGYCSGAYTEAWSVMPPPPPPTISTFRLGVHAISDFAAADAALGAGAPACVIMDGKLEAVNLARKYPKARIVYRRYLAQSWPTPAEMVALLGPSANDPPISFVGLNEGDGPYETGTPQGILARAAWDREVTQRIRDIQPNATYYAGSLGHGNPDITRPDICDAMRQGYSGAYNSGLFGFDLHNYTKGKRRVTHPPQGAAIIDPMWFERRADWFFSACGFDPHIRKIISCEAGVEAGAGGFSWAQYSQQQYREWQDDILSIMRAPLVVSGVSYPSPYEFATVFQFGSNGDWAGYDVRAYLGVMREQRTV